ncbi:MAG: BMC domain-containing protein [Thermoanaerobaculia bacterium]|nr:BMC domain-containing protein [Thermoanaerobaculia bacterium]
MIETALALVELPTVVLGIRVADAMAKRVAFDVLRVGTVQPGRYLVLVGGSVAAVEEGVAAAREVASGDELDLLFLPAVARTVVDAMVGARVEVEAEALGVFETRTVAATLAAADAAVKGASVDLVEIHLADGLGGKGYFLLCGAVSDVEAAIELGSGAPGVAEQLIDSATIAQLQSAVWTELRAGARFSDRLRAGGV